MRIGMIWAQARDGVIGAGGDIPWHVPEDMARFRSVTMGHPVVMGRRTWDSFPERFRPLPGRRNIVVSRDAGWFADGAQRAGSLDEALSLAGETGDEICWIIGGGQLYREALSRAEMLEVTEVDLAVAGDTHAPSTTGWIPVSADPAEGWHTSRTGIAYRFVSYCSAGTVSATAI